MEKMSYKTPKMAGRRSRRFSSISKKIKSAVITKKGIQVVEKIKIFFLFGLIKLMD